MSSLTDFISWGRVFCFFGFQKIAKKTRFLSFSPQYSRFEKRDEPFSPQYSPFSRVFIAKNIKFSIVETNIIFKKVLRIFIFFQFFSFIFCDFLVKIPICGRHYFSKVIDILAAKNDTFEQQLSFFLHFCEFFVKIPIFRSHYFSKVIDILAAKK